MVSTQLYHCQTQAPPSPNIIFSFLADILHPFLQVFNLSRLISQKHKETNWKYTQQQPQTTRKLGESDNYETHQITIYISPNFLKDNTFNLKGYYWSIYSVIKALLISESTTIFWWWAFLSNVHNNFLYHNFCCNKV